MTIRWTAPAADDLYSIVHYIQGNNPSAARKIAALIYEGCESLVHLPHRGRKGKQLDTRELVFFPLAYIAVYRIREDIVEILHIWHGAQDQ